MYFFEFENFKFKSSKNYLSSSFIFLFFFIFNLSIKAAAIDSLEIKKLHEIRKAMFTQPDSCIHLLDSLVVHYNIQESHFLEATAFSFLAKCKRFLGLYEEAMIDANKSYKIFDRVQNTEFMAIQLGIIGSLHIDLDDKKEAFRIFKRAEKLAHSAAKPSAIASVAHELGNYYYYQDNIDSSFQYFNLAEFNYLLNGDLEGASSIKLNKIGLYVYENLDSTVSLASKLLNKEQLRTKRNKIQVFNHLGVSFFTFSSENKNYLDSALHYYNEALELYEDIPKDKFYQNILLNKVTLYKDINQKDSAFDLYVQFIELSDSLQGIDVQKKVLELSKKYDSERLLRTNAELEISKEKAQKRSQIIALTGIIMFLIFAFVVATLVNGKKRLKQEKIIAQQQEKLQIRKLNEILNHHEIEKITSMLEGQEVERKRIAQELHDRVGSLLASLRYQFEELLEHLNINESTESLSEKTKRLLSEAFEEVRRISHNLAVSAVSKLGLERAANELLSSLEKKGKLKCNFFYSAQRSISPTIELVAYRILQEALTNIIKYADASEINVSMVEEDAVFSMLIEDNGKGFNLKEAKEGIGLKNMRSRAEAIGGKFSVESQISRGTTLVFEMELVKN